MDTKVVSPYDLRAQMGVDQGALMLTADMKHSIAITNVPFNIKGVKVGMHEKHGEYWQFAIKTVTSEFILNMSDPAKDDTGVYRHPEVVSEYHALKRITDEGVEVGPYLLEYIEWDGGLPFYKLSPATMPDVIGSATQNTLPFEPTTPSTKKDK